ncbi:MAG: leucine dehydrogenase [Firmicutes bacterium]|nr:leucine dehydrogenase [Bacillota bacterium]MCL2256400.1 leucine dehydrogenase [Bacillota bacterium]
MKIFDYVKDFGHEQLVYFYDKDTGLKALTCIHSTVLGPSLGGTRFWNYATEEEAVFDVLRLARGMTYKSACAGLNLGGGKSVIIGDAKILRQDMVKREAFFRAFGRFVEGLAGRYITAEDSNTSPQDMDYINMETDYVVGLEHKSGNPSPFTALGVFRSIQACCEFEYGSKSTKGRTVMVQGAGGAVGSVLCKLLHEDGAKLVISGLDETKLKPIVENYNATVVGKDDVYSQKCDIFAPCAFGGGINDKTIKQLKCKIVAPAANNVLLDIPRDGKLLHEKGIVYAPDYVANSGGVINVFEELNPAGYNREKSVRQIDLIFDRTLEILKTSKETNTPSSAVADKMAENRIEAVKNVHRTYLRKRDGKW